MATPDTVTAMLAATVTVLDQIINTTDPGVPLVVRQQEATKAVWPDGGWMPGDPSNCYIVSSTKPEEVDRPGVFSTRIMRSGIQIARIRPIQGTSSQVEELPPVRQNRTSLRQGLAAIGAIQFANRVGGPIWEEGPPYDGKIAGNPEIQASTQFIYWTWKEQR